MPLISIQKNSPSLILAPMEGVTDAPMRDLMGEVGGFSFAVTEFLRISQNVQPPKTFQLHMPELKSKGLTPSGLPVQLQLLGGNPEKLAQAASQGVSLGAPAVDLNFGCPAPTVNKNDGGATLLLYPERIENIVRTVRAAVRPDVPVSAKLRLGWENPQDVFENAQRAQKGGAAWITLHARTKIQGYKPPAYWEFIGEVQKNLDIPVVANGDIWTLEDFQRCREITQCEHFMLGRGALSRPQLSLEIAKELGLPFSRSPQDWAKLLKRFIEISNNHVSNPQYFVSRIKQWLNMAQAHGGFFQFDKIRTAKNVESILDVVLEFSSDNGVSTTV